MYHNERVQVSFSLRYLLQFQKLMSFKLVEKYAEHYKNSLEVLIKLAWNTYCNRKT